MDGVLLVVYFFFFKQKTAYEMRISDWSSDVCSSDLLEAVLFQRRGDLVGAFQAGPEHRAAAIDRPAIAIGPHDVDVARALRLALGQDQRAFVDRKSVV